MTKARGSRYRFAVPLFADPLFSDPLSRILHNQELIGGTFARALLIEGAQGHRQSPPLASSQITPWKVRCALLFSHSSVGKHLAHCLQADEQKQPVLDPFVTYDHISAPTKRMRYTLEACG